MLKTLTKSFKKGLIPSIAIILAILSIFKIIELAIVYIIIRFIAYMGLAIAFICLVGFLREQ